MLQESGGLAPGPVYSAPPVRWRLPFKQRIQNAWFAHAAPKEAAKLLESSALLGFYAECSDKATFGPSVELGPT